MLQVEQSIQKTSEHLAF